MTRELARALDEEFAVLTPPSAISGRAIVQKGRSLRRRRRFAYGGGGLAVLAALVAVVAFVASMARPAEVHVDTAVPPYPVVDQPEFPLPALDPGADYLWNTGPEETTTPETLAIDAAWRERLSDIEDARAYSLAVAGTAWQPLTEANYDRVGRRERELMIVADGDGGSHALPERYRAPYYSGGEVVLDFGAGDWAERLSVEVYAKGSFRPGPGQPTVIGPPQPPGPYVIDGCADFSGMADQIIATVDYTCTEKTGAGGEKVLVVESSTRHGGIEPDRQIAVALFRTDGTAVVVRDLLTSIEEGQPDGPGAFVLTHGDLIALAYWIPPVIVK